MLQGIAFFLAKYYCMSDGYMEAIDTWQKRDLSDSKAKGKVDSNLLKTSVSFLHRTYGHGKDEQTVSSPPLLALLLLCHCLVMAAASPRDGRPCVPHGACPHLPR